MFSSPLVEPPPAPTPPRGTLTTCPVVALSERRVTPSSGLPAEPEPPESGPPTEPTGTVGTGAGGDTVGPGGVTDGTGEGSACTMLVVIRASQMTVAPPPFPEPLHWFTVTANSVVEVEAESTEQRTLCVPPPPFPASLH